MLHSIDHNVACRVGAAYAQLGNIDERFDCFELRSTEFSRREEESA